MKDIYFKKYLKQATLLPSDVAAKIQTQHRDKILFYALSDLDEKMCMIQKWIVIGESSFYIIEKGEVEFFDFNTKYEFKEELGKTANVFSILI